MICDVCKTNPATVYLTQIVDGNMKKVNLCESCSKDKGVSDPTGFALADLLLGLGETQQVEQASPAEQCPACGFTQADFKKTGRLGCSDCYATFADGLSSLLQAMHKGIKHTGKVPARLFRDLARFDRLNELKRNLEEAVTKEDYESAATIRDEIRQLESGEVDS
ncbi:MAG: UvrB/UvrC motif-containing protein [Verrucomicrobia bacterium]|nr:UvrB/UvrC motif-containing protein [Verrucomicrobiota bacterium]MBV9671836.1 UvrB/UvrC motif-containing protein [Verrucomicrobiota bacterium]